MGNEHITAKWAREQSETKIGKEVQKQLDECLSNVEIAVSKNEKNAYASGYLHELTKQELAKRGFKLTFHAGYNQRDPDYNTISW